MKLNHEERLLILNLLKCELVRLSLQIEELDERAWTVSDVYGDSRIEREVELAKQLRAKKLELEGVTNLKDKIERSIEHWERI